MRVRTAVLPVVVLAAVVTCASPASASGPAGMATNGGEVPSLRVSPTRVVTGGTVRVTGHCDPNTNGYVVSDAFRRDATHEFANVAAVPITTDAGGDFSTQAQIPANRRPGVYPVGARCGGGNLGISTTLVVTPAGVPTAGPIGSGVPRPVEVRLGRHRFGALTAPDAVVARVVADGVGWDAPREGAALGPSSFEIASDGAVWLLDAVNRRLLGWRPDTPDHPAAVVPLPVFAADLALGPNGTFYLTAAGTPAEKTMVLYSLTADGRVRWRALLATDLFNAKLRMGPDRVLYDVTATGWIPVATAAGAPLSVAAQRRLIRAHQPTAGGGRLVVTYASRRDARIAVLDVTGRPIRAWRVTGDTDMAPPDAALPALVNGDPVVPFDLFEDKPAWKLEQLAVRLTASGAPVRVRLDNTIWGDKPTTEYRTGPDGAFYQLQTSRTAGVKIVRYRLDARPPRPTVSGHAGGSSPTAAAQPAASVEPAIATALPATAQAKPDARPPSTRRMSASVLAGAGGIGLAVVVTVGTALLVRRRRHLHRPGQASGVTRG